MAVDIGHIFLLFAFAYGVGKVFLTFFDRFVYKNYFSVVFAVFAAVFIIAFAKRDVKSGGEHGYLHFVSHGGVVADSPFHIDARGELGRELGYFSNLLGA